MGPRFETGVLLGKPTTSDIMTNHRRQVVLLEVHLPLGRPLHGVFQVSLYQAIKTRKSLFSAGYNDSSTERVGGDPSQLEGKAYCEYFPDKCI